MASGKMEEAEEFSDEVGAVLGLEGRVLFRLAMHAEKELTKQELAREAGTSLTFLNSYYPTLEKYGLVVKTRRIGKAMLFKANSGNDFMRLLTGFIIERVKQAEIAQAKKLYEEHYADKETPEEVALLLLLKDINAKIPPKVERELEKRKFIAKIGGRRIFTHYGRDVAESIREFDKLVLGKE